MAELTHSPLQPQKMTREDLAFLVYNMVALRFQYPEGDTELQSQGFHDGDGYSLSYPDAWWPIDEKKAEEFERKLGQLVEKIYTGQLSGVGKFDGSFLLFKDIEGARSPETHRGAYPAPFYTVGVGTHFSQGQQIGCVRITRDLVVNKFDIGIPQTFNPVQLAKHNCLIDYLTGQIIVQIHSARESAPDQTAATKVYLEYLDECRRAWENLRNTQKSINDPKPGG